MLSVIRLMSFTVTVALSKDPKQPFASIADTLYVLVAVGDRFCIAPVLLLLLH